MAISLVMASCGPVTEEGEKEESELLSPEEPQYGGTLNYLYGRGDVVSWDPVVVSRVLGTAYAPVLGTLLTEDWTEGLVGAGKIEWVGGHFGIMDLLTGELAESWEIPDDETIIFNIRKGVKWQNIPPVNGREFTAEDAVFNEERTWTTPTSFQYGSYKPEEKPISFKALDRYTLEVKTPVTSQGQMLLECGLNLDMLPPEVIAQYGDMNSTKNPYIGTGPFMLEDFTSGTSATYVKNRDFWKDDPIGPGKGNQLPYIDTYKVLLIPDYSTQLAAFRTGKADILSTVNLEDLEPLMKTNPETRYLKRLDVSYMPLGRLDKDFPWNDLRVRQAMEMAIDREAIVNDYYQGESTVYSSFWPPTKQYSKFYIPWEEQSDAVKELFTHNPEKARQLMAEAGYPNGFKTKINCQMSDVDFVSIIKEDLLDIGIDMEIDSMESGVYWSLLRGRKHEEWIMGNCGAPVPHYLALGRADHLDNCAFYETPVTREGWNKMLSYLGRDDEMFSKTYKDTLKSILADAVAIYLPAVPRYSVWQPWVQNYHGEHTNGACVIPFFCEYFWIDQELKKSMGY